MEDLIVDTMSVVSMVCTQLFDTISNEKQLQPIKGRDMIANRSLLNINGFTELTVTFDKIEITHTFLCVDTKLSLSLLGYDFLCKTK